MFWGDKLRSLPLLEEMELNPEFCGSQALGETILHSKGTKVSHIARIGHLTF